MPNAGDVHCIAVQDGWKQGLGDEGGDRTVGIGVPQSVPLPRPDVDQDESCVDPVEGSVRFRRVRRHRVHGGFRMLDPHLVGGMLEDLHQIIRMAAGGFALCRNPGSIKARNTVRAS